MSGRKRVWFTKIRAHFGDLRGRTIALWGLAFKPNTDDMREAPSRVLMEALWQAGARCAPTTRWRCPNARGCMAARADLTLCKDASEALQGADALRS